MFSALRKDYRVVSESENSNLSTFSQTLGAFRMSIPQEFECKSIFFIYLRQILKNILAVCHFGKPLSNHPVYIAAVEKQLVRLIYRLSRSLSASSPIPNCRLPFLPSCRFRRNTYTRTHTYISQAIY